MCVWLALIKQMDIFRPPRRGEIYIYNRCIVKKSSLSPPALARGVLALSNSAYRLTKKSFFLVGKLIFFCPPACRPGVVFLSLLYINLSVGVCVIWSTDAGYCFSGLSPVVRGGL